MLIDILEYHRTRSAEGSINPEPLKLANIFLESLRGPDGEKFANDKNIE